MARTIHLTLLPARFVVARLPPQTRAPTAPDDAPLWSCTVTADEISIVCVEGAAPPGSRVEPGWRALRVTGPLDFALIGVVRDLTTALADAEISVFVISTYDTDYLLIKDRDTLAASRALRGSGYSVSGD